VVRYVGEYEAMRFSQNKLAIVPPQHLHAAIFQSDSRYSAKTRQRLQRTVFNLIQLGKVEYSLRSRGGTNHPRVGQVKLTDLSVLDAQVKPELRCIPSYE